MLRIAAIDGCCDPWSMHLPEVAYALGSWLSFGFGRLEANGHALMVAETAADSRRG